MAKPNLKKAISAILFVAGNPVELMELIKLLDAEEAEIRDALSELTNDFAGGGLIITEANDSYQMSTSPEVSTPVKNFLQAQLREKLTDAAVETLAIIAYKQPVSKAEIEVIRGVNSQYILRLLLQRGLVEKVPSQTDARVLLYRTTHEFLHHLGLKSVAELPSFEEITKSLTLPENPGGAS